MSEEIPDETTVERNEAILIGDDRLVKVAMKMRAARAELLQDYEARDKLIKDQLQAVNNELLRRLIERGAENTKTQYGTAFVGEQIHATIADDAAFTDFVLTERDLGWYVKRVKIERLREYIKEHGVLPPGINVHRERILNMRAPRKAKAEGSTGPSDFDDGTGDNNATQQEQ